MRWAIALALASLGADAPSPPPAATSRPEAVQDVVFLGDRRPIFVRLRIALGDRPFRAAWADSVAAMHAFLDRDGDGTVTRAEAERGSLATLVRIANGGTTAMPRGDLDGRPRDGVISRDELAEALRTALGPFRVQAGKLAGPSVDSVFERLDRDANGQIDRAELDAAEATLRRLDLDEDELIDAAETEPFADPNSAATDGMAGGRARAAEAPPVLDLAPDEGTLRPVRALLTRYDKARPGGPATGGDNKLTAAEFAIDPAAFARADADGDAALDVEELRRFLARVAPDLTLDVTVPADPAGKPSAVVAPGTAVPAWARVRALGDGEIEIAADEARLEFRVDAGASGVETVKQVYQNQFNAADADNNGYVEREELTKDQSHPSPLAALFDLLDRDGDGKLYPAEVDAFIDAQARSARERMVLTASDQGRAIFSILDQNRDRMLGLRELRGTPARVAAWDRDRDGKVAAAEIPHHYRLTLGRGTFGAIGVNTGLVADAAAGPRGGNPGTAADADAGPNWFRRMDRNRDNDVSPREFRGPVSQFERLDRDRDGLIDPSEAGAATATASAAQPGGK